MLGRALDIAATGVPLLYKWVNGKKVDTPSFDRGVAFQIAWNAMGYVAVIPYWDFWQLEDRRARAVRKSSTGWVKRRIVGYKVDGTPRYERTFYETSTKDGLLLGYKVTGHLHLQDDPTVGVH